MDTTLSRFKKAKTYLDNGALPFLIVPFSINPKTLFLLKSKLKNSNILFCLLCLSFENLVKVLLKTFKVQQRL